MKKYIVFQNSNIDLHLESSYVCRTSGFNVRANHCNNQSDFRFHERLGSVLVTKVKEPVGLRKQQFHSEEKTTKRCPEGTNNDVIIRRHSIAECISVVGGSKSLTQQEKSHRDSSRSARRRSSIPDHGFRQHRDQKPSHGSQRIEVLITPGREGSSTDPRHNTTLKDEAISENLLNKSELQRATSVKKVKGQNTPDSSAVHQDGTYRLLSSIEVPESERGHFFSSIALLADGNFAVSDVCRGEIVILTPDMKHLATTPCPNIWRLCATFDEIFLVAVIHENECMITLTDLGSRRRVLPLDCGGTLRGICFQKIRYSLCTLCNEGEIHIVNMEGHPIRTISTPLGDTLHMTFTVNEIDCKFYCTGNHAVVCLDSNGNEIWRHTNDSVEAERGVSNSTESTCHVTSRGHEKHVLNPCGLALDGQRLYVTDTANHRVVQLSLDGQVSRDIVTDDIQFPFALCIRAGALILTQNSYVTTSTGNRVIKVFKTD